MDFGRDTSITFLDRLLHSEYRTAGERTPRERCAAALRAC